jgi:hypothetical protein
MVSGPLEPGTGGFEALTDIAVDQPETHDRQGYPQLARRHYQPDNITDLTNLWNDEYSYIRKATIFFEQTASSPIPADKLDPMKGEVHFLQAWMYFELMRTYGGVPIITKSFQLDEASFDVPRNSFDECATFILGECDQAMTLLDGQPPAAGKISKEAAMALKSQDPAVSLRAPCTTPQTTWPNGNAAEVATKAVIDLGKTLHPNYDELYLKPLQTDEIIFGKSFTPGTRIPDWGFNYDYWPSGFDARQRIMPTQAFINMFQLKNGEYPYMADGITVNPASGYDPQHPNENRDPGITLRSCTRVLAL